MIKVNIFVKQYDSDSVYSTKRLPGHTTINDIMTLCSLSRVSVNIYINGKYIKENDWNKSLSFFNATSPTFLSVQYGEERPKQGKPVFNRGRR